MLSKISMIIQKKIKTKSLVTAFDASLFKKQYIYHAIKVKINISTMLHKIIRYLSAKNMVETL